MADELEAMFAATEAANGDPVTVEPAKEPAGKKPEGKAKEKPAVAPVADDLTGDADDADDGAADDGAADDGAGDGADDGAGDDGGKRKTRSKPLTQRLSEETAKRREAEARAERVDALEAQIAELKKQLPGGDGEKPKVELVEPKAEDYEFGEADPEYSAAHTKWLIESTLADRDSKQGEATAAETAKRDFQRSINEKLIAAEAAAKERYDDFDDRISEAFAERGPLSQMTSLGIAISPVGGDLAYRLATDPDTSDRIERLAKGGAATANAFALALGELEGEYIEGMDDGDLDVSDPLDMARMTGRMRARMAAGTRQAAAVDDDEDEVVFTKAPEPPAKRLGGTGGKTKVADDTDDTRAFYREHAAELD